MPLPRVPVPEDTIKLYSLPKPIRYRPYLVGEEKLLMIAQESDKVEDIEAAIKQLIRDCTFGEVDVMSLASFDVEYMFLKLRARSVSNIMENRYRCINKVPSTTGEGMSECGQVVPIGIDLNTIELTVPEDHSNKVWLSDDMGLLMKYPTMKITDVDLQTVLPQTIKSVFTKDGTVYEFADYTKEEQLEFINQLTLPMVGKITTFFETLPRLEYTFMFRCPACKYEEKVELRGLEDFFD